MLGLPKATELNKQLPKNMIYEKFRMNNAAKERIDSDISRIYIVNEVSTARVNIDEGKEIKSFFVMSVLLKHKEFDEKNIVTLSKLIPQNMLLVLEHEGEAKLAVFHQKLLQTQWQPKDSLTIELKGLDLDRIWENIIIQVGDIHIEDGNTLDQQVDADEKTAKHRREIARLEKLARAEKQPKKKFELVQRINDAREKL